MKLINNIKPYKKPYTEEKIEHLEKEIKLFEEEKTSLGFEVINEDNSKELRDIKHQEYCEKFTPEIENTIRQKMKLTKLLPMVNEIFDNLKIDKDKRLPPDFLKNNTHVYENEGIKKILNKIKKEEILTNFEDYNKLIKVFENTKQPNDYIISARIQDIFHLMQQIGFIPMAR